MRRPLSNRQKADVSKLFESTPPHASVAGMPRDRRQKAAGLVHHVVHRGINRQAIFREPEDYALYLHTLAKVAKKNEVQVLAYCLMTNHLHLLLEDRSCRISETMHALNGFYTTAFNRRHQCEGALLRGRFYSKPVLDGRYELSLFRYIHLNPVKAGIVAAADAYPWSSYLDYINRSGLISIASERLLRKLREVGIDHENIHSWVRTGHVPTDYVREPQAQNAGQAERTPLVTEDFWLTQREGSPLLDVEGWKERHPESSRSLAEDREALRIETCCTVARRYGVALHELAGSTRLSGAALTQARGVAMLQCKERHDASYKELSVLFCMSVWSVGATLSRARSRLRGREEPSTET